jgi:solute carrier family 27 fatty acid transporter 1/4
MSVRSIPIQCLAVLFWALDLVPTWGLLWLLIFTYVVTGGYYTIYLIWQTLGRDLRGGCRYLRLIALVYFYQRMDWTVAKVFSRTAKKYGDKTCLIFEDKSWSFRDLEDYSNCVARVFLRAGLKHGDCVAIFMENRPEYVGLWLGCTKIGLVPALINNNLVDQPLIHSIRIASASAFIYGSEVSEVVKSISSEIGANVKLYVSGSNSSSDLDRVTILDPEIASMSHEALPESIQKLNHFTDKLLYIYTSGTTGNIFKLN